MSKVVSKDGTVIGFNRLGKGEPIILVDGALCSRSFGPMPKLARVLSSHFAVITYDRRGRGESGDASSHAVEREVEDIEALIAAAGGTASLFGASSSAVANAIPGAVLRMLKGQTHNASVKALAPVLTEFFGSSSGDFSKSVDFVVPKRRGSRAS